MAIEVKFCTAKRVHVPVRSAMFEVNRFNESPQRAEKPDFWPVNKFNTASLPLRGILPVITSVLSATGGRAAFVALWVCYHDNSKLRAPIFTKLGLQVKMVTTDHLQLIKF